MTFDTDIGHTGTAWHYICPVRRSRSRVRDQGHMRKHVTKVVGATSSDGSSGFMATETCLGPAA